MIKVQFLSLMGRHSQGRLSLCMAIKRSFVEMRRSGFIAAMAALVVLVSAVAWAEGFKEISAQELKKMLDSRAKMELIDARTTEEYLQGHIPGAVSIDPNKVMFMSGFLPKDKDRLLIFYCRGTG